MERTVARFEGCLGQLGTRERQVLVLRAGVGPAPALSSAQVARRLRLRVSQVRRIERRGLRQLGALGRAGRCTPRGGAASSQLAALGAFALPTPFDPTAMHGAGSGGAARSGVEGAATHGSDKQSAPGISPPFVGHADYLALVLVIAAALVALGLLVRRELPRR